MKQSERLFSQFIKSEKSAVVLDIVSCPHWIIGLPLNVGHFEEPSRTVYVTSSSETIVSFQGYRWTISIVPIRFVNAHDTCWTFSGHSIDIQWTFR